MHKYIRKYQDKNGKWVYVYHEQGLPPKNMTINEFPQTTAKEPSIPVIEHAEHEKGLPIKRIIMLQNIEQNPHMPQSDYANARQSSVPNIGEDIVWAARHKTLSRKISGIKANKDGEIQTIPAKAMKDLCETLGLPVSMGSYNEKIGIAIGARNKGTAKAHYKPSKAVINLTRTFGAGSLAHGRYIRYK